MSFVISSYFCQTAIDVKTGDVCFSQMINAVPQWQLSYISSALIRCIVLVFLIYILEAENNKISSFIVSTEVALKVLNEFCFVEVHG